MKIKFGQGNKKTSFSLFIFIIFSINSYQQNNLEYYLRAARENNPLVKENYALAEKAGIAEKRVKAEYLVPQAFLSADVYYPPMIGDKNDPDAIGYDVAITDGGLYSFLFNVRQPLFTKAINETLVRKARLTGESNREKADFNLHQLERDVTERYILAYQILNQIEFENNLKSHLEEQKKIIEELTKEGIYTMSDVLLIIFRFRIRIQN